MESTLQAGVCTILDTCKATACTPLADAPERAPRERILHGVRLLGPVSAETDGVPLQLRGRKQRAVFALLALQVKLWWRWTGGRRTLAR